MIDLLRRKDPAAEDPCRRARPPARPIGTGVAVAVLLWTSLWSGAWAGELPGGLPKAKDRMNYSIGYALGRYLDDLERGGTDVELEAVLRGALDALSGAEPPMSEAEIDKTLDGLEKAVAATDQTPERQPSRAMGPARAGAYVDDFAALNASREGVTTLPSGVQYEVLKAGSGRLPQPDDAVAIDYEGSLTSGVVFDTTYEDGEPLSLRIDEIVVPGLREALLLMDEGAKWRVVIPPGMGFGASGNNQLRKRDLIYEIELVSVQVSGNEPESPSRAATSGPHATPDKAGDFGAGTPNRNP